MPCRALLIESNPPTTAVLISPARIIVAAIPVAVMLARHTSFSVVAGTVLGRPPRTPAWRAGFLAVAALDHVTEEDVVGYRAGGPVQGSGYCGSADLHGV